MAKKSFYAFKVFNCFNIEWQVPKVTKFLYVVCPIMHSGLKEGGMGGLQQYSYNSAGWHGSHMYDTFL